MTHPRRACLFISFAVSICFAFGTLFAQQKEKPALFETVEPGTLSFALYEDFFPFSFVEDGKKKGLDLEIALKIAEKLKLPPKIVFIAADENIDDDLRNFIWKGTSVERGRIVDVMMHVPYDRRIKWQNELVGFFAPYHSDVNALLVPLNDEHPYRDMADLEEIKIGVEIDTLGDFILLSHENGKLAENVVHYRQPRKIFAGLANGEIDAAMGSITQLRSALSHFNLKERFEVKNVDRGIRLSRPWTVGVAVSQKRLTLGYEIESIIEDMAADGTLAKIYAGYGLEYEGY